MVGRPGNAAGLITKPAKNLAAADANAGET
jgi:hypothetical protein